MNTPADEGNDNLRYAEYVLGVLDADARAAVAQEVQTTDEAAAAVALWQRRLMPLSDEIASVTPGAYVWVRIHDDLQLDVPVAATRTQPSKGLWNNLPLWHWLGIGASALAVALLVVIALPHRETAPAVTASAGYMVSTIQQDNGVTGWTATMDLDRARMVVVPAAPVALASGRAPELWLIPQGGKPISVGMITRDAPTTITLDSSLLAKLGPTALLAVSVEPIGGSPTGQPTGAVIAKGSISGSPDAHDHVVRVATTFNGMGDGRSV
ncbi:anti-sigma factor [Rhodanobacter sp. A1T4]|uniref:anti-sigma factor n=1 Tax=Rhodanobacter sp. A1T4 TaxID=2723087 RepID=UPI0016210E4D|nr:anti-sigma factor [Rhodanobacter sp. A1T4]MBB6246628.1 anti-sigma-K factor RskA [Rhodanobacter sp. A1T4]